MKRHPDYLLSEVAGTNVLIPIGKAVANFNELVSLNGMGVTVWNLLEEETTPDVIVDAILAEYDVDRETAAADIAVFLETLRRAGCLIEEDAK